MAGAPSAESSKHHRLGSVFRHKPFAWVWAGALLSNIGNWMENSAQNWAVAAHIYDDPGRAAFLVELLNFADFIPAFFLVLAAGVITDRVNIRRYLLMLQCAACVIGMGLAVVAYLGYASPWVVIAFTFAEGVIWALNGPPWQAVVPHLVPRAELVNAIAANAAQFNLARLIGPFLAGMVILHFGIAAAFAINACTFVPVIVALSQLPDRPHGKPMPRGKWSVDLTSALRIVAAHAGMRRLSMMQGLFVLLSAPVQGLLAVFVAQQMSGDSRLYGAMLGGIGAGALIGSFVIGRVPRYYPRHHLIPLSMLMSSLFMLGFSFVHSPWIGFPVLMGMGFFWMLSMNSSNAANQLLASDENRGRVLSVMLLCNIGTIPIGHLVAAGLTQLMTPPWVMRSMVMPLVLVMIFFLLKREPAIDSMERRGKREETWLQAIWEAITAQSHRPIAVPIRKEIADAVPPDRAGGG
jgi:MFS family permease